MANVTMALMLVLAVNVFLYLGQAAILEINPDAPLFFNREGTVLQEFDKNNGVGDPILDTESTTDQLPSTEGSVSPTTGNFFTDMFSSIKNWFAKKTGISYLLAIVSAPYNILKTMHLPNSFVFAIGTLWYVLTLFLIVAFFWGRDV